MTTKTRSNHLMGWGKLVACLLMVLIFIFYLAPALESFLHLEKIGIFIDENNIEANMYFYTEVSAFSEAGIHMNHAMRYSL